MSCCLKRNKSLRSWFFEIVMLDVVWVLFWWVNTTVKSRAHKCYILWKLPRNVDNEATACSTSLSRAGLYVCVWVTRLCYLLLTCWDILAQVCDIVIRPEKFNLLKLPNLLHCCMKLNWFYWYFKHSNAKWQTATSYVCRSYFIEIYFSKFCSYSVPLHFWELSSWNEKKIAVWI